MKGIHVSKLDNVATALEALSKGSEVLGVTIREDIPSGHKFATQNIRSGQPIIKYASHIGIAAKPIQVGEWVHVHNLEGERGRGDTDHTVREIKQQVHGTREIAHSCKNYELQGYRRPDGSFGFRNHVLVIPSVHCANKVVRTYC